MALMLGHNPLTTFTVLGGVMRQWAGEVMSNFGYRIDADVEDVLRSGPYFAQHSAWHFCGYVWFEDGQFHEQVDRYHVTVDVFSAATLSELMTLVNDKWGSE